MSNEQVALTNIHICSTKASNLPLFEHDTTLTDIHICSIEASMLHLSEPVTHSCKLSIPYSVAISDQFYIQWFHCHLSHITQAKHCPCASVNRRVNSIIKCSPNWPHTIVICLRVWHNKMLYLFHLQQRQTGTYLEWLGLHKRHQSSPIQQPYQQVHSIQNTLDEHP